jgi:hypothetical protein
MLSNWESDEKGPGFELGTEKEVVDCAETVGVFAIGLPRNFGGIAMAFADKIA